MGDKIRIPTFQLQKVYDDGSQEAPELHELNAIDTACRMGRRGFLLTSALGAGALAAFTAGCVPKAGETTSKPLRKGNKSTSGLPTVEGGSVGEARAHVGTVTSLSFSPDSRVLASASTDKTVKLWSIPGGTLNKTLPKFSTPVLASLFTPDGKTLVAGEENGTLTFWKTPFAKPFKTIAGTEPLTALTLSPDGKILACSVANHIHLRQLPSGTIIETLNTPPSPRGPLKKGVPHLVFSPDSTVLAYDLPWLSEVALWSIPSRKLLAQWKGHTGSLGISADGSLLTTSNGNDFTLWSIPSGKQRTHLDAWMGVGAATAFSPDNQWLAATHNVFTILVLHHPFTKASCILGGHGSLSSLAFSGNSRYLAAGSANGIIHIWEVPGEKGAFTSHAVLVDPEAIKKDVTLSQFTRTDKSTFIAPCGTPLPPGAVCTCNCVSGKYSIPITKTGTVCTCNTVPGSGGTVCTCNTVPSRGTGGGRCTCNRICTCVPVK